MHGNDMQAMGFFALATIAFSILLPVGHCHTSLQTSFTRLVVANKHSQNISRSKALKDQEQLTFVALAVPAEQPGLQPL